MYIINTSAPRYYVVSSFQYAVGKSYDMMIEEIVLRY
jgi:hypothetical protein